MHSILFLPAGVKFLLQFWSSTNGTCTGTEARVVTIMNYTSSSLCVNDYVSVPYNYLGGDALQIGSKLGLFASKASPYTKITLGY